MAPASPASGPLPAHRALYRAPGRAPRRALGLSRRTGLRDLRPGGGHPRNRHRVGRAGDIGHARAVAELHRRGVASVLAADPDLEPGPRGAPARDADLDQLADALLVQLREGIGGEQLLLQVEREELADVVAA